MSESRSAEERHAAFRRKMAHEMRTPLGSMLMLAELLADNTAGRLGEREIGYARKIQQAGSEVSGLLSAVLDLSRIETGAIAGQSGQLHVAELAAELRQVAADRQIAVDVEVADGLPATLATDRAQLKRLVGHLLDHLVRAAQQAEIGLSLAPDGEGAVAIELSHGGTPVPDDLRGTAFDPFQPGQRGKAGLDLPIGRALAGLLGGRLEVAAEGTSFVLILPLLEAT